MHLGCRRMSWGDAVSGTTPFSCIACVPFSLAGRTEAVKACAAPVTWPKPFPAVSAHAFVQSPTLVGLKPHHISPQH